MHQEERRPASKKDPLLVLTIGHSTRPILEFIQLLQTHEVTRIVDVRTIPKSRYNPQFNQDTLAKFLHEAKIAYTHMAILGGLRHAARDSVNTGWRNDSFRGYADYMQTPEFKGGIKSVIALAKKDRIALMCAEAVPWRCHRSLIEDALLIRGVRCEDIMDTGARRPHTLTSFAQVSGATITYPPEQMEMTIGSD